MYRSNLQKYRSSVWWYKCTPSPTNCYSFLLVVIHYRHMHLDCLPEEVLCMMLPNSTCRGVAGVSRTWMHLARECVEQLVLTDKCKLSKLANLPNLKGVVYQGELVYGSFWDQVSQLSPALELAWHIYRGLLSSGRVYVPLSPKYWLGYKQPTGLFADASPLAGLTSITSLDLSATEVADSKENSSVEF